MAWHCSLYYYWNISTVSILLRTAKCFFHVFLSFFFSCCSHFCSDTRLIWQRRKTLSNYNVTQSGAQIFPYEQCITIITLLPHSVSAREIWLWESGPVVCIVFLFWLVLFLKQIYLVDWTVHHNLNVFNCFKLKCKCLNVAVFRLFGAWSEWPPWSLFFWLYTTNAYLSRLSSRPFELVNTKLVLPLYGDRFFCVVLCFLLWPIHYQYLYIMALALSSHPGTNWGLCLPCHW